MEIEELLIRRLRDRPSQLKVAQLMLRYGLSVEKKKICCGNIEISAIAVANSAGVDRRVITSTIDSIAQDPELAKVFMNLKPTASYIQVAKAVGWHVISITVSGEKDKPGVLATVIGIVGDASINIKQVIVENVAGETKNAFIITEWPLPGAVYNDIIKRGIVDTITLY